jgi:hypothetical protein
MDERRGDDKASVVMVVNERLVGIYLVRILWVLAQCKSAGRGSEEKRTHETNEEQFLTSRLLNISQTNVRTFFPRNRTTRKGISFRFPRLRLAWEQLSIDRPFPFVEGTRYAFRSQRRSSFQVVALQIMTDETKPPSSTPQPCAPVYDWLATIVIGFLVTSYWRGTWTLFVSSGTLLFHLFPR